MRILKLPGFLRCEVALDLRLILEKRDGEAYVSGKVSWWKSIQRRNNVVPFSGPSFVSLNMVKTFNENLFI